MIVDNLKSCYVTRMRIRVEPELIAIVRWYFAPPGALPLPTESAFGSMVWENTDREYPQPDLGEIDLTRTWDAGKAPMGVTGTETPTPLDWYVNGVPVGVEGPFPPCAGTLPAGFGAWLRPEEIAGVSGVLLSFHWPAAPGTLWHGWNFPGPEIQVVQDGGTGRTGVLLVTKTTLPAPPYNNAVLQLHRSTGGRSPQPYGELDVDGDFTLFVVFRPGGLAGYASGFPGVGDLAASRWGVAVIPARSNLPPLGVGMQTEPTPFTVNLDVEDTDVHVVSTVLAGSTAALFLDGVGQGAGVQNPAPWNLLGVTQTAGSSFLVPNKACVVFEVIYWPRALGAPELVAVNAYFAAKYGVNVHSTVTSALGGGVSPESPVTFTPEVEDMPVGGIVAFAGTVVPNGYLACDGTDYDQTVFPALFGVIGSTWNTFRGQSAPASGRFRVPLLAGLALLGVGGAASNPTTSARALADQGGEEQHTLSTGELPAHTHGVTDPGHNHPLVNGFAPISNGPPGAGTFGSIAGLDWSATTIDNATTGITATDAAGGGGGHNNVQPFAAVNWIIKT